MEQSRKFEFGFYELGRERVKKPGRRGGENIQSKLGIANTLIEHGAAGFPCFTSGSERQFPRRQRLQVFQADFHGAALHDVFQG